MSDDLIGALVDEYGVHPAVPDMVDRIESGSARLPESVVLTTTRAKIAEHGFGAVAAALVEEMTSPIVEDDEVGFAVEIAGQPKQMTAPPCQHRVFMEQVVHGEVHENADGTGPIVGHQALIKGRCGECGCPAVFDASTARQSLTVGEHGVVVDFHFTE